MSNFSTYVQEQIYNWMFRATNTVSSPLNIYLALSTSNPIDDGSGIAEPVDGSYSRQIITFNAPSSVNNVGTSGSNDGNLIFGPASVNWGSITHGALFDSLVGGNMLLHWQWSVAKLVENGDSWVLAISDLQPLIR